MQSLVWSLRLMTIWFVQWELSYMSRRSHDTDIAYTHLSLLAHGHRSGRMLCWKVGCDVEPSLFILWNFYDLGINIYWEKKSKGHCFLCRPTYHFLENMWITGIHTSKDIFFHCYSFHYSLSSCLWYYRICQKHEIVNVKTRLNCRQYLVA
jgi:hypothetical protein